MRETRSKKSLLVKDETVKDETSSSVIYQGRPTTGNNGVVKAAPKKKKNTSLSKKVAFALEAASKEKSTEDQIGVEFSTLGDVIVDRYGLDKLFNDYDELGLLTLIGEEIVMEKGFNKSTPKSILFGWVLLCKAWSLVPPTEIQDKYDPWQTKWMSIIGVYGQCESPWKTYGEEKKKECVEDLLNELQKPERIRAAIVSKTKNTAASSDVEMEEGAEAQLLSEARKAHPPVPKSHLKIITRPPVPKSHLKIITRPPILGALAIENDFILQFYGKLTGAIQEYLNAPKELEKDVEKWKDICNEKGRLEEQKRSLIGEILSLNRLLVLLCQIKYLGGKNGKPGPLVDFVKCVYIDVQNEFNHRYGLPSKDRSNEQKELRSNFKTFDRKKILKDLKDQQSSNTELDILRFKRVGMCINAIQQTRTAINILLGYLEEDLIQEMLGDEEQNPFPYTELMSLLWELQHDNDWSHLDVYNLQCLYLTFLTLDKQALAADQKEALEKLSFTGLKIIKEILLEIKSGKESREYEKLSKEWEEAKAMKNGSFGTWKKQMKERTGQAFPEQELLTLHIVKILDEYMERFKESDQPQPGEAITAIMIEQIVDKVRQTLQNPNLDRVAAFVESVRSIGNEILDDGTHMPETLTNRGATISKKP